MNYITTNHQGGIGNVLFKLSASISLAIENNVEYKFSNEFIRQLDRDVVTNGYDDYRVYYDNLLRNIKFINKLDGNYGIYKELHFNFQEIPYRPGTNLLLEGYFQSERYFLKNKEKIISLFEPSIDIKNHIYDVIPDIGKCCSIHVRRGDYLLKPQYHPQQSIDFFKESSNIVGQDKKFLIFSDDLDGIKENFDFIENKQFISLGKNYLDLYAMSLCENNIICNSTFSWWGAYLNKNKNKIVVSPKNWFGPSYSHLNTDDLIPKTWIKI